MSQRWHTRLSASAGRSQSTVYSICKRAYSLSFPSAGLAAVVPGQKSYVPAAPHRSGGGECRRHLAMSSHPNKLQAPQDSRTGGSSLMFAAGLVASWYAANIGVILLNKYLLSVYGFKCPVLLTLLHMVGCSLFTSVFAVTGFIHIQPIHTRQQFFKVVLLSLVFTATIILGNASLRYIPVSFNQAIGATTPLFTALLGFLMLGHRESVGTYLALVPVVFGIIIATGFEPSFHMLGFIVCVAATALRGFKTVFQGMLMSEPAEKLDSFSLLAYMSPLAMVWLIPTTMILEPESPKIVQQLTAQSSGFLFLITLSCSLAFAANLLNFLVTKHTSALTLQVLGNVKGVVATVVSVLLFKNLVSWQGCVGYAIAIGGVFLYSDQKRKSRDLSAATNGTAGSKEHGHGKLGGSGALEGAASGWGGSDSGSGSPLLLTSESEGGKSSSTAIGDAERLSRYGR